jgi:hypothetical protein
MEITVPELKPRAVVRDLMEMLGCSIAERAAKKPTVKRGGKDIQAALDVTIALYQLVTDLPRIEALGRARFAHYAIVVRFANFPSHSEIHEESALTGPL